MSATYQGASPNSRFLAGDVPGLKSQKGRFGNAVGVSMFTHVAVFFLLLFVASRVHDAVSPPADQTKLPSEIVWLAAPGPGGGGGGGGNRTPEPPRKVEAPGPDKITVPAAKPATPVPTPKPEPVPEAPPLTIPAQPMQSGVVELPGMLASVPTAPSATQGSGSGGGAGTGRGTGMGPGQGSGLGEGYGGNFGGGAARPGNGITSPRLRKDVKPNYTADAMRAKIQGTVLLEAVVMPDGTVGQVRVTRSLDPTFGLDREAERTVKLWSFYPGTDRTGNPVPVIVAIEMSFTLR